MMPALERGPRESLLQLKTAAESHRQGPVL
jgi:hypothetical protein